MATSSYTPDGTPIARHELKLAIHNNEGVEEKTIRLDSIVDAEDAAKERRRKQNRIAQRKHSESKERAEHRWRETSPMTIATCRTAESRAETLCNVQVTRNSGLTAALGTVLLLRHPTARGGSSTRRLQPQLHIHHITKPFVVIRPSHALGRVRLRQPADSVRQPMDALLASRLSPLRWRPQQCSAVWGGVSRQPQPQPQSHSKHSIARHCAFSGFAFASVSSFV
jgi:hypothetical protein